MRRLRLPENRGVPGSIPGLATSPFYLLIVEFCARHPAAFRSRREPFSGFGVQFTVLNRPRSWVTRFQPGDKDGDLARLRAQAKVRPPGGRAVANGLGCTAISGCGDLGQAIRCCALRGLRPPGPPAGVRPAGALLRAGRALPMPGRASDARTRCPARRARALALSDASGLARRDRWRAGGVRTPEARAACSTSRTLGVTAPPSSIWRKIPTCMS